MDNAWYILRGQQTVALVHELEYHGEWMGDEFVTVTVKSPLPVTFATGDMLTYRGETFYIDYDPNTIKQARKESYGEAFVYENIKLYSKAHELKNIAFRDYVLNDNGQAYSQQDKFSFFAATVRDLTDRIKANLDRINYGQWSFEFEQNVAGYTNINITCDKISCWDALKMVYDNFGLTFIIENTTIKVGFTSLKVSSEAFKYGKGKGLKEIESTADEGQSIVTKLNAYGSDKNLPRNYYANLFKKPYFIVASKEVLADATTGGSETYLLYTSYENANVKSSLTRPDTKCTLKYGNSTIEAFGDGQMVGEVQMLCFRLSGSNAQTFFDAVDTDDKIHITSGVDINTWPGIDTESGYPAMLSINNLMLPGFPSQSLNAWVNAHKDNTGYEWLQAAVTKGFTFSEDKMSPWVQSPNAGKYGVREGAAYFDGNDNTEDIYPTIEGTGADYVSIGSDVEDNGYIPDGASLKKSFTFLVPSDILDWSEAFHSKGTEDMVVSMKTGYNSGRSFKVEAVTKATDYEGDPWKIKMERELDNSLNRYFPYSDGSQSGYCQVVAGDTFVVTGIQLPKSYVDAAAIRLLKAAIDGIEEVDHPKITRVPHIDEIYMARERDAAEDGQSLYDKMKAGLLLKIQDADLGIDESTFIDQLTIKENGNNGIPTFDVVLRDEKEMTFKESIQKLISISGGTTTIKGGGMTAGQVTELTSELYPLKKDAYKTYLAIDFFNNIFTVHGTKTTTTHDEDTDEDIVTVEEVTFKPNDWPTGSEYKVTGIEAKYGLWTKYYLSALGMNSDNSGGDSLLLNEALTAINSQELAAPTVANTAIVWDGTKFVWGSTGSGTSGIDWTALATETTDLTKQQIHVSHLASALSDFVTEIGVSGDTLTWKRNGVAQTPITVPYALHSTRLSQSVLSDDTGTSLLDFKHDTDLIYTYKGGGNSILEKPADVTAFGVLSMKAAVGYNAQILIGTNDAMYYRLFGTYNGNPDVKEWHKLLTDASLGTVLNSYYTKTQADSTFVKIDFFKRLFQAFNGTTAVNPNDTTTAIDNLKLMVGTWTQQYLSALGVNSTNTQASGIDWEELAAADGSTGIKQIDKSHLIDALNSYVVITGTGNAVTSVAKTGGNTLTFTLGNVASGTTYTFATGTTNGTFKVTPSGGTAQSVAIYGLKALAYKDSLTANDLPSHNHNDLYVSSVAIGTGDNANKLAVTKNGSTTNLTIPYATKAGSADSATEASKLSGTATKSAWGQAYWSGGIPQTISGDISNADNITINSTKGIYIKDNNDNVVDVLRFSQPSGTHTGNDLLFGYGLRSILNLTIYGQNVNVGHGNYWSVFRNNGHLTVNADDDTTRNIFLNVGGSAKTSRLYLHTDASDSTKDVYLEYDSNGGVHLVGAGFYADTFVSALGLSGDTSQAIVASLSDLTDVNISSPAIGQVLKYRVVNGVGEWYNGTDEGVGTVAWGDITGKPDTATRWPSFSEVTSHPTTIAGYGITDAKIMNGTITLGSNSITPLTSFTETDPTVPSWAKQPNKPSYTFGELTSHPDTLTGYGISANDQLFDSVTVWKATRLADNAAKTAWGRTYWQNGQPQTVSGLISDASGLKLNSTGSTYGYIDFHYASASSYTSNIYEVESGILRINHVLYVDKNNSNVGVGIQTPGNYKLNVSGTTYLSGLLTAYGNIQTSANNGAYIQIGAMRLIYDSQNSALKLIKINGSTEEAGNFYATGGVSALGLSDDTTPATFDESEMWKALGTNITDKKISQSYLNLTGYALTSQIPTTLKNPHALKITLNGVETSYDGSVARNLTINTGLDTTAADARYLKLDGTNTMTGVLSLKANQNSDGLQVGALNMNNSNIYGLNGIYTSDAADYPAEGFNFYRDATHVDTLWIYNGEMKFIPNRELGTNGTAKTVAFMDSNVASATKLASAVKLWGNSFDGSTDLTNSLKIANNNSIFFKNTSDSDIQLMLFDNANTLFLGNASYSTHFKGNNLFFHYGTANTQGVKIASTGAIESSINMTIEHTGTTASLFVAKNGTGEVRLAAYETNRGLYDGSVGAWIIATGPTSGDDENQNTFLMRGNVGVGIQKPSYKLHVSGKGYFTGNVGIGTAPSNSYALYVSGKSSLYGNVSVGQATPSDTYALNVKGSTYMNLDSTTNGDVLTLVTGASWNCIAYKRSGYTNWSVGCNNNNLFYWWRIKNGQESGDNVMSLTDDGNLNVGSITIGGVVLEYDSQNGALKVRGTASASASANLYATGGVSALGIGSDGTSGGGVALNAILTQINNTNLTEASSYDTALVYQNGWKKVVLGSLAFQTADIGDYIVANEACQTITVNGSSYAVANGNINLGTISANIPSSTANYMTFYSSSNAVGGTSYLRLINETGGKKGLYVVGDGSVGNTASDMISGVAGLFRYGDKGARIRFAIDNTASQKGEIIYTDHNASGGGVSWHFVTDQGNETGTSGANVVSDYFTAKSKLTIGSNILDSSTNKLYVNGNSKITGNLDVDGSIELGVLTSGNDVVIRGDDHYVYALDTMTVLSGGNIAVNTGGSFTVNGNRVVVDKDVPLIATASGTELSQNGSLDAIRNAGTYWSTNGTISNSLTGIPAQGLGNTRLWHIINTGTDGSNSQWSAQLLLAPNSARWFTRTMTEGNAGTWKEFAFKSDLGNYIPKSGGTVTGGLSVTDSFSTGGYFNIGSSSAENCAISANDLTIYGDNDLTLKHDGDIIHYRSNVEYAILDRFNVHRLHHATGTDGSSGYVKICEITIGATYKNSPIEIVVCRRADFSMTRISIQFVNANSKDPALGNFIASGATNSIWLYKISTSKWGLYVLKGEAWDKIEVADLVKTEYMDAVTVAWTNVHASSLPTSSTNNPLVKATAKLAIEGRVQANTGILIGGGSDTANVFIDHDGTTALFNGKVECTQCIQTSDINKKDIVENVTLDLEDIARSPLFRFTWKDGSDRSMYIGTSAQYWQKNYREFVAQGIGGHLGLDYAGTALAAAVSVARVTLTHEEEIADLKRKVMAHEEVIESQRLRIVELETEVEQLKAA